MKIDSVEILFDQRFDRFGAHAERVDRQTIPELRIAGNLADDELGSAFGDRRPGFAAVMAGQRDRQNRNAERSDMLRNADARLCRDRSLVRSGYSRGRRA